MWFPPQYVITVNWMHSENLKDNFVPNGTTTKRGKDN